MLFPLIFFLTVGGIMGEDEGTCDGVKKFEECIQTTGVNPYAIITHPPENEELLEKCPKALEFFECFTGKLNGCDEEEIYYEVIKTHLDITKDLCNEDSELHEAYSAHVGCYRTLEEEAQTCHSLAKDVYRASYALLNHDEPEDVDAEWVEIDAMCMVESVRIACLSYEVLKTCGKHAYTTMTDFVSRSLLLNQYCSPNLRELLKTSLLDSLELEEETRNVYGHVFNNIKK